MKLFYFLLFIISSYLTISFAQSPDITWIKSLGDSSYDSGNSIVELSDGNILLAGKIGTQLSPNAYTTDIWVIKITSDGELINSMNYGGIEAIQIIKTTDDEYMVLGNTFSNQGNTWEDILLIKLNSGGDSIWTKKIKFSTHDYAEQICQSSDNNYFISVHSQGIINGNRIIKTDAMGDTLWSKFYYSNSVSILPSDDAGVLISVWIRQTEKPFKMIKLDSNGNLVWEKSYLGGLEIIKLIKSFDENLFVASQFFENRRQVVALTKFDQVGDSIYTIIIRNPEKEYFLENVSTNPANEILLTGYSYTDTLYPIPEDGFIIKLNSNEEIEWSKIIGGDENEQFNDAIQLRDGSYFGIGEIGPFYTVEKNLWLVKLGVDPNGLENNTLSEAKSFDLFQNYPNPFNPSTTIKFSLPSSGYTTLKIYNSLGQEVAALINKELTTGTSEVEWNASSLPSGIYFYQLKTESYAETRKMILIK